MFWITPPKTIEPNRETQVYAGKVSWTFNGIAAAALSGIAAVIHHATEFKFAWWWVFVILLGAYLSAKPFFNSWFKQNIAIHFPRHTS